VVIYLMNLILLSIMLALASAEITFAALGGELMANAEKFVRWLTAMFG
jgi:hypothetical protein